ncbi:hypothetical protein RAE01_21485, partial [Bacillus velezensis]|uniref:hypothetical protein n=1 Tax=Bacillus velezensis TaxID=492670 RepID=UPI003977765C
LLCGVFLVVLSVVVVVLYLVGGMVLVLAEFVGFLLPLVLGCVFLFGVFGVVFLRALVLFAFVMVF